MTDHLGLTLNRHVWHQRNLLVLVPSPVTIKHLFDSMSTFVLHCTMEHLPLCPCQKHILYLFSFFCEIMPMALHEEHLTITNNLAINEMTWLPSVTWVSTWAHPDLFPSCSAATTRGDCRRPAPPETAGRQTATPFNGVFSRVHIIWCISTWTQWAMNMHGCGLYRCVHCAACTSNVRRHLPTTAANAWGKHVGWPFCFCTCFFCTSVHRFKESYGDFPRFAEGWVCCSVCVCGCVIFSSSQWSILVFYLFNYHQE